LKKPLSGSASRLVISLIGLLQPASVTLPDAAAWAVWAPWARAASGVSDAAARLAAAASSARRR